VPGEDAANAGGADRRGGDAAQCHGSGGQGRASGPWRLLRHAERRAESAIQHSGVLRERGRPVADRNGCPDRLTKASPCIVAGRSSSAGGPCYRLPPGRRSAAAGPTPSVVILQRRVIGPRTGRHRRFYDAHRRAANTHLTTVMIAEKLADEIRREAKAGSVEHSALNSRPDAKDIPPAPTLAYARQGKACDRFKMHEVLGRARAHSRRVYGLFSMRRFFSRRFGRGNRSGRGDLFHNELSKLTGQSEHFGVSLRPEVRTGNRQYGRPPAEDDCFGYDAW